MLIFPKAKTRLLISVCKVFSVLSLWNCFRHLRWKHWEFCLSAMMFEAQQKVPKKKQAVIWWREALLFSSGGRHSGRFTLRWCSQPSGAHAGPQCFLSGESLLCLSSGVCACGEVLAFRSALAPPVHRKADPLTHPRWPQTGQPSTSVRARDWIHFNARWQKKTEDRLHCSFNIVMVIFFYFFC